MNDIWQKLPTPIIALAPMADVTDAAFRRLIASKGSPDVMWTEFVSADGLYHTREIERIPDADNPLLRDLAYDQSERPIVAQLFSADPAMMEYAAALVCELGFDGVDINMGCPDRNVVKQGSGAGLIRHPNRARELLRAAKRGAAGRIPVSVKTRIGDTKNELETWIPMLLAEEPAAITVHARTRKEQSLVPARWEHVREAVVLRDKEGSRTRILGNGDLVDVEDALQRVRETGADGAMLGRAIFGNPWLFAALVALKSGTVPTETEVTHLERIQTLAVHADLFEELCGHKSFAIMKRHVKAYVQGFDRAKELRAELMNTADAASLRTCVEQFLDEHGQ